MQIVDKSLRLGAQLHERAALAAQTLLALLLVVYISAIGVAAGALLVAVDAFKPNRRLAWVLKVLIIGAATAALLNRLLAFLA
jgi:hypothetical protein